MTTRLVASFHPENCPECGGLALHATQELITDHYHRTISKSPPLAHCHNGHQWEVTIEPLTTSDSMCNNPPS